MPNLNVGLGTAMAGTACGFVIEPEDPSIGAVLDDTVRNGSYEEQFYECDTRDILAESYRGDKLCVTYDSRSIKSDDRTTITYTLTGCEFSHAMCAEDFYMSSYGCQHCPNDKIAMNYFDMAKTLPDSMTNKYYHSNTTCAYCESGYYLSGSTCVKCPSDTNGHPIGSYGNNGIDGCFASLGYSNQTQGKDASGSYVIITQQDFSEMVIDSQTGYWETEYYCSYKS